MKAKEFKKLPTSKDILSFISEEDIFNKYLGGLPTKPIKSPLRVDKHGASFNLFRHNGTNKLMYKDFVTEEVGDCFVFVKKLLKMDRITDVLCRIAEDFNLNQFETRSGSSANGSFIKPRKALFKKEKNKVEIRVKRRNWNKLDVNYWKKRYGLGRKELEYCNVYPISHFFVGDTAYVADKRAYVFVEKKDGEYTYKVYQPYNTVGKKWVSNNNYSVWELWSQLPPRGRVLIITSSRKDAMVIKKMFPSTHITSCSLQSEGVVPKMQVIDELKSRFREIYVLYDNDFGNPDNPGRAKGKKIAEMFGLKQIEIPDEYKRKDISDYISSRIPGMAGDLLIKKLIKTKQGINIPF